MWSVTLIVTRGLGTRRADKKASEKTMIPDDFANVVAAG